MSSCDPYIFYIQWFEDDRSNNVAVVSGIGPVSTILHAHFVLGEKLVMAQVIGTLLGNCRCFTHRLAQPGYLVFFKSILILHLPSAQMAKLVDALPSGGSVRKDVQVRILFWALNIQKGNS